MESTELKPCPFCGGRAVLKAKTKHGIGFTIWCECSKCHSKIDGYCPNIESEDNSLESIEHCKNSAIKAWNRRADNE